MKKNHKQIEKTCFVILCILYLIFPGNVFAQQARTISGIITDQDRIPLIGVSVILNGTSNGIVTDADGKYAISATGNVKLKVAYLGYQSKLIDVSSSETEVNVVLEEDVTQLEDVVVVGYSTQKRANIAGSVAVIGNEKLVTTKNQNVQNMLTGKLPGVRVIQKTAEPGNLDNVFDIRGFGTPLIIVDGSSISMAEFQRMDPNDIESISILKDASAAIYGVRSSNGVVLIQTKKGSTGKSHIEYSMYYGIQNPSELLKPVSAYDRAVLANEKFRRDNPTATELRYSDEALAKFKSGESKSYDWYDAVIRSAAPQQQHNVSMNGGTDKLNYYLNFGYLNQESIYKSGDMNYSRYNLRSNINVQVLKDLTVGVRLSGSLDNRDRPQQDAWGVFSALWRTPTTLNIYANDNPAYNQQIDGQPNSLALTNSDLTGYKIDKRKIINTSFDAAYAVPYVKGLTAKALFSYNNTMEDNSNFLKQYQLYNYSGSGTYDPVTYGKINELTRTAGNSLRKTWNVSLNYKNTFNETHTVNTALIYEENYEKGEGFKAFRELIMPLPYLDLGSSIQQATGGAPAEYANKGLIGLLNYDYKSRYLFEGSFRYDGSSRFLPDRQWDLFYSTLVAWRISEEAFIKDNLSFVNNLKLRASYGRMGDDGANLYEFLGGYNYGTEGGKESNYPKLYDLGNGFVPSLSSRSTPNFNIGWLEIYTTNIGLDTDLWKGLFGLSFDIFQRTREGLYATRAVSLPETFGSTMPQENLNSDRTKGLEIELRHRNTAGDLRYELSGNFSITRALRLTNVHTPYGNSYDEWKNTKSDRYANIWFLYGDGGRLQSFEERATYPYSIDQYALPGDYIRQDWNNDGTIDDNDKYPAAIKGDDNGNSRPYANFAFNANFAYKGFDLDFMFQGSALGYVVYGEQLSQPLTWDGNALPYFLDRWHPEDPKANPRDPATVWHEGEFLYGARGIDSESMFGVQNGAYLRLKTVTLGYTLPKSILKKTLIENVRFYVNGYNIYTFTGVIGLDPERPNDQSGSVYPINRTVNFGVQVKF
jgi:TonB-linked SusC/RagA family outer membrane protein